MTESRSAAPGPVADAFATPLRAAIALLWALMAVAVIARSVDPDALNHDVAWVLHCVERTLGGEDFYRDVLDENPPLVFWLSALPVAAARLLDVPSWWAYNAFLLLLTALACAVCQRVLARGWPEAGAGYRHALTSLLAVVAVLLPGYDYGQRENLFFVLAAPYLFGAAAAKRGRALGGGLGVAAGLMAGVGLAIKPHFLLLWAGIEIWLVVARPATRAFWRVETRVIAAVQVLYAACVLVFARDYFDVARIAMALYTDYRVYGSLWLFVNEATGCVLVAAGLFALLRPTPLNAELRQALLVAALLLLEVALLQGVEWRYHYLPAEAVAVLLIGVALLGLVDRDASLGALLRPRVAALPLIALLLCDLYAGAVAFRAGAFAWGPGRERPTLVKELTRVVAERAAGRPIYLMSTSVKPSFPVVNLSGARWASRFCCLWMLPGLYSPEERATRPFPYHAPGEMNEHERFLLDAVVADLRATPPQLLIVQERGPKQVFRDSSFDYLEYFGRDARFAAIFAQYQPLTDVGPYRIYERRARSRPGARRR